jgi:ABC-type iron transport system FetAB permease component
MEQGRISSMVKSMRALTTSEIWKRFAQSSILTTFICIIVAFILLKTTGVPSTYPPLLPQQIISGTIGGALLVTLGYCLLTSFIRDQKTLNTTFVVIGVILLIASFHLPYRLSYTTSPRFAGVTVAAQIGQGFLHTLVVVLSMFCFLRR